MPNTGLPAAHATALHLHFGVIDKVLRAALKGFQAKGGFTAGVAVDQALHFDLSIAAGASVHIVLIQAATV